MNIICRNVQSTREACAVCVLCTRFEHCAQDWQALPHRRSKLLQGHRFFWTHLVLQSHTIRARTGFWTWRELGLMCSCAYTSKMSKRPDAPTRMNKGITIRVRPCLAGRSARQRIGPLSTKLFRHRHLRTAARALLCSGYRNVSRDTHT